MSEHTGHIEDTKHMDMSMTGAQPITLTQYAASLSERAEETKKEVLSKAYEAEVWQQLAGAALVLAETLPEGDALSPQQQWRRFVRWLDEEQLGTANQIQRRLRGGLPAGALTGLEWLKSQDGRNLLARDFVLRAAQLRCESLGLRALVKTRDYDYDNDNDNDSDE